MYPRFLRNAICAQYEILAADGILCVMDPIPVKKTAFFFIKIYITYTSLFESTLLFCTHVTICYIAYKNGIGNFLRQIRAVNGDGI